MILRVIWRETLMSVMSTIEYRGAFLIYMINTVAGPLVSLLVWLTVSDQGVALPYNRSQFVTYYVLLSIVSMLTATWTGGFLASSIRMGGISPALLRPVSPLSGYVGNNLGEKIVKLPLLLPLIMLVAIAFHNDLRLPSDPLAWLLFLIAVPLAAVVAFLLDITLCSLAFWMDDVWGLLRLKGLVGAFLAGQFVPLALFPPGLSGFLEVQPFRYTLSFPLEVLTGHLSSSALMRGFGWQVGYCIGLWACYRIQWYFGLRTYSAIGA
jgi:ABC-2 type transport system permease protein